MNATGQRIRATIVEALTTAGAARGLDATRLAAFAAGEDDVSLADLPVDSVVRMELLVALELEHGVLIAPEDFAALRTLAALADHATARAAPGSTDGAPRSAPARLPSVPASPTEHDADDVRAVRLFRRAFRGLRAAAELQHLLFRFDERLTPLEVAAFDDAHRRGALLPRGVDTKYTAVLEHWLARQLACMRASGKTVPEPYVVRRIAPAVFHFAGPGPRRDKTLVVGFSMLRGRRLFVTQAVMLQHLDAARYDLLLIADVGGTAFRSGEPGLGTSEGDVVRWVARQELVREYRARRTIGCSAGSYPALLTGCRIGAEVVVCVSGRFPSERHLWTLVRMYTLSVLAARRASATRTVYVHGTARRRDVAFARRLARLAGGSRLNLEVPEHMVDHDVLNPLADLGELGDLFSRTLLAPLDADLLQRRGVARTLRYPSTTSG